jgi:dTDP-4-amino-4,6-dideoxygalactose transaminase
VALFALLTAMNLKPGDEVILQAFTCLAVPAPILALKLRPVYVDIDPNTYTIDPGRIEKSIGGRTKVIIVQHTYGIPAELDEILAIARRHGLAVIEDCCHVAGSRYQGRELGSFGDAAFYSYEWGKPVVIGLGGSAVVHNQSLRLTMQKLYSGFREPGRLETTVIHLQYLMHKLARRPSIFWPVRDLYRTFSERGLIIGSFRREELQGQRSSDYEKVMARSLRQRLLRKMRRAGRVSAGRRETAIRMEAELDGLDGGRLKLSRRPGTVLLRYPLLTLDKERVLTEARKRRIELAEWFSSPIHPLCREDWRKAGYIGGSCPAAERVAQAIVTVPLSGRAGSAQVGRTVSFVRDMGRSGRL